MKTPEQRAAYAALNKAIRDGLQPRARTFTCVTCEQQADHLHHHLGYAPAHWLDVIPLCNLHHRRLHATELWARWRARKAGTWTGLPAGEPTPRKRRRRRAVDRWLGKAGNRPGPRPAVKETTDG